MSRKIANSVLNASTIDILNTIRQNANYEYQQNVPVVTKATEIPHVGEILFGYPALANTFLNALVNRIALVRVNAATFNNHFAELKKGRIEYGETIEEVFVSIAKAREFNKEKAEAREFKRTLPDVRSAFHVINYRVQYPVTIDDVDLRQAFLSIDGVQDLIAKIVDAVYTAAEYDEYLLFKYVLIKGIAKGQIYPQAVNLSGDFDNAAITFRAMANQLTFMSNKYNAAGVTTATPKSDQYIFMDSEFNARFDVKTLAAAFNMDKADFTAKLKLIDDWHTFDNERFEEIRANSDGLEEVTDEELALLDNVKAVLLDGEFFQFYDNVNQMTETYVASGMYWNYFYNVWKTVSWSPFSNAVVFVDSATEVQLPASLTVTVDSKDVSENGATVFTFTAKSATEDATLPENTNVVFVQTGDAVSAGIAVHKYGSAIFTSSGQSLTLEATIGGTKYTAGSALKPNTAVGATITMTKQ